MRMLILFLGLPLYCWAFETFNSTNSTEVFNTTSSDWMNSTDETPQPTNFYSSDSSYNSSTKENATFSSDICPKVTNLSVKERWQGAYSLVTIGWTLPENFIASHICIAIESTDPKCSRGITCDTEPETQEETLPKLCSFHNYTFSVNLDCGDQHGENTFVEYRTKPGTPSEPKGLRLLDRNETSLVISWDPPSDPNGPIDGYIGHYSDLKVDKKNNSEILSRSNQWIIGDLRPWTNYTIRILAFNYFDEDMKLIGPSAQTIFLTLESESSPPKNISVSRITNSSFSVQWEQPDFPNGIIAGYEVFWELTTVKGKKWSRNSSNTERSLNILDSVLPYAKYIVYVVAINTVGYGRKSDAVHFRTAVGIPDVPENVTVEMGPLSLYVTWNEPKQKNGPIDGYILAYKKSTATTSEETVTSGNVYEFKFQGLKPWTDYDLELSAFNENNEKQKLVSQSIFLQERTLEYYPGLIENITIDDVTNRTFSLSWLPPMEPNGIITEYIAYYRGPGISANHYSRDTHVIIENLLPFTDYTFQLAASTAVGWGKFSEETTITTDVGVPGALQDINIKKLQATEVHLTLSEPVVKAGPLDGFLVTWWDEDEGPEHGKVHDTSQRSFNLTGVNPWTNYSIKVQPYNVNKKKEVLLGGTKLLRIRTAAAVPLAAILNSTVVQSSTSVWIEWRNTGIFPGPTSYIIEVWKKSDGCSNSSERSRLVQNHTDETTSWKSTSTTVRSLDPYTVYYFRVITKTEAGSAASDHSLTVVTDADAPSEPRNFQANCTFSSISVFLSWESPKWRNGIIVQYRITYASNKDLWSKAHFFHVHPVPTCEKTQHRMVLQGLHPEAEYKFTIQAKTQDVERYGPELKYDGKCVLPAGVPPIPDNMSKPEIQGTTQQDVTLKLSKLTFSSEMGNIVYYSLIVASPDIIGQPHNGSMAEIEPLPVWAEFWNHATNIYQATPHNWNPFQGNTYDPLNCHASIEFGEDVLECTVGWEKNCTLEKNYYCNGPLKPGKVYGMKLRGFTKGGFAETYPLFVTTDASDNPVPLGLSIGLVVTFIILAVVSGVYYVAKKRNRVVSLSQFMVIFRKSSEPASEPAVVVACATNGIPSEGKQHRTFDFPTFLQHVKDMMSDSALKFSVEYDDLKKNSARHPCTVAEMEENRSKNRWTNILPFDHSRVKLLPIDDEPGSDYINASYIPGFFSYREYIASQGPLPSTVDDFWRMIWEQKISMIVMLAQCIERGKIKCEQYWPKCSTESVCYGDLSVEMTSESILSAYTIRSFNIALGSKQCDVKQLHYTRWPDFGCPESPEELINFVRAVKDHLPHRNCGPILVHCSAGVGRTGTFIAVDRLLHHIQYNNYIDVYNTVLDMREHRINMVQTEDQYIYIHKCLRDLILESLNSAADNCHNADAIYSNLNCHQNSDLTC